MWRVHVCIQLCSVQFVFRRRQKAHSHTLHPIPSDVSPIISPSEWSLIISVSVTDGDGDGDSISSFSDRLEQRRSTVFRLFFI